MASAFQSFTPRNSLLKKHIAYFYFDQATNKNFQKNYSFFPHTYTTLSFYEKGTFSQQPDHNYIQCGGKAGLLSLLTRKHHVTTVIQQGPLHKIGIVFYPLGLNCFINEPYNALAQQEVQLFLPENRHDWELKLQQCFSVKTNEEKLELLESFLLTLYNPRNFCQLSSVLTLLQDHTNTQTIQAIAEAAFVSPRSLNRLFAKELAITPELYRAITRFRYIIQQKAIMQDSQKFTQLAYESGYSDQAYLTSTFKRFTSLPPGQFFKQCSLVGNTGIVWRFHGTKNVV